MSDADEDIWRARLAAASHVRVRTGHDPRWRKFGNASEMGVMSGLRWATWLGEVGVTPRLVPGEFWALDGERVEVACPCGHSPVVAEDAAPSRCECERYFCFVGGDVWCFNTKPPEPIKTHNWRPADGGTIVAP